MAVARDDEGRLVMVKQGTGPGAERLRREAAALELGAGAGCVDVVGLAEEPDGTVCLRTAWVGGGSLATALPLGPVRLVAVARELAGSVAELHGRGLVHGRLAADHVLLDGDRPVLCGLGDARLPGETDGPSAEDDVASLLALLDAMAAAAPGELADRLRGVVAAGTGGGAAAVADRLAAIAPEDAPPVRQLRPRRAAPPPRPSVRPLALFGAAAVVLLALAFLTLRDGGGSGTARMAPTPTEPPCPPAPAPAADLDGDGCPEALEFDGGVIIAGDRRWRVAEAGDVPVVGDWDCDGRATPAVVRPATGEVWVYDGWATADRTVTARPGPAAPGTTAARAAPQRDGCARLEVTTAGGDRRLLDLP